MLLLLIGFLTFIHLLVHLFSICCFLLCVRPHVRYWGAELNKTQSSPHRARNPSGGDHQTHEPTPEMVLVTSSKKFPLLISLPSYSETIQNPDVYPHNHSSLGEFSNTFC